MSFQPSTEKKSIWHRWVDWYIARLSRKAQKHREEIRKIQQETDRTQEQVIQVHIFEKDVRQRGILPQEVYTYTFRIKDGRAEFMSLATEPDITVTSDFPTLRGIHTNSYTRVHKNGSTEVVSPFTPTDAWRSDLLLWDGPGTGMKSVRLMTRILPMITDELHGND